MTKIILTAFALIMGMTQIAAAHCQIPCGIFDDKARFERIYEDARTIQKAMTKINEASASKAPDYHTIARWTATKEEHAQNIQDIAAEYFLAQRVKAPAADADEAAQTTYITSLKHLHAITIAAMKAKQTTDAENIDKLIAATEAYEAAYMQQHGHQH